MGTFFSNLFGFETHEVDVKKDYDEGRIFYASKGQVLVLDSSGVEDNGDEDDVERDEDSGRSMNVYKKNKGRLTKGEQIGQGYFGRVFEATLNGEKVAIKEAFGSTTIQDLKKEAEIMSEIDHKNITRFIEVWTNLKEFVIVMEYLENGNLLDYLKTNPISSSEKKSFAINIAEGMQYMEERNIVHRDLAARNVLLDSDLTAKVADFGLSKFLNDYATYQTQNAVFPPLWTAPEGFNGTFSSKSDVWSFGILFMEIITEGDKPYNNMTFRGQVDLYNKLKRGIRQTQPDSCSDKLYELVMSCWEFEPSDRPDFTQICEELANIRTRFF